MAARSPVTVSALLDKEDTNMKKQFEMPVVEVESILSAENVMSGWNPGWDTSAGWWDFEE